MFSEHHAYVSLGLSRDNRLGQDLVVECVNEADSVRSYTSYNSPTGNTREGTVRHFIDSIILF